MIEQEVVPEASAPSAAGGAGVPSRPPFSTRTKIKHLLTRLERGFEAVAPHVLPIFPNRGVIDEVDVAGRTVRCYHHFPDDPQLIHAWDTLSQAVPGATVFHSPHWQRGATRVPDATGRLRLLTVHERERLVAAVPLERRRGGHWCTAGGGMITQYHDPLIHPDGSAETWEALLRSLPKLDRRLASLTIDLQSPGAESVSTVPPIARGAGYHGGETAFYTTDTVIDLPPTWDAYLALLRKNDRGKLRRRLKKVEEAGDVRLVVADTEPAVMAALPGVLDLMQQGGGSKARKTRWLFRPHLAVAAPALARTGRIAVYQLMIGNRLAAGEILLPQGDRWLLWNGGMDRHFREWSPGIALIALVLRRAIELGRTSADFLLGMATYKQELGAIEKPMHRLVFAR